MQIIGSHSSTTIRELVELVGTSESIYRSVNAKKDAKHRDTALYFTSLNRKVFVFALQF